MDYKAFEEFCKLNNIECKSKESMKLHTSFKIGGEADLYAEPSSISELQLLIKEAKRLEIPMFILGKGSNILVSDRGIEGLVINLLAMDKISVKGDILSAQAGASLAAVCTAAAENSLTGIEFAYGIPASVGGALSMNAGAYGGEMSFVVDSAEYIDENGELKTISLDEMELGYRTSIFKKSFMVVASVNYRLEKGDSEGIKAAMRDYIERRKSKQPLEYPSAGSTFKRPVGYFAGALIEQNGLKGKSVGGAQISEKHAGFVINTGDATSADVLKLMDEVKEIVLKADGVLLEPEVIFVGRK